MQGNVVDLCPVGALTSGIYRYHTRPWEMRHVGTICAHCADGCKTTLGVRNNEIIRGNNRDRSGINGEFLCIKGRYGFDFTSHPERLHSPLRKTGDGFAPVSWAEALALVARKFREVKDHGGEFGVIGSTRTTHEENYYLQKFVRQGLGSNNIDHHRTGDVGALVGALAGNRGTLATTSDLYHARAVLVVGCDLAQEHPLLAYQIRANWRHHGSHTFVVTPGPVREDQSASHIVRAAAGEESAALDSLREALGAEPELVVVFGASIKGAAVTKLVEFGVSLGIPVKYVCLVDYPNSRGAMDMGLAPDLLPGYRPVKEAGIEPGLTLPEMLVSEQLGALWIIGANPLKDAELAPSNAFLVVQDLFLTETAQRADVVLPVASAYEKTGTVTNTCGEVQRLIKALDAMGTKSDLEIIGLIAAGMGIDIGAFHPEAVWKEIRQSVTGYNISLPALADGGNAQASPETGGILPGTPPELIRPAGNMLFRSGTLGRYSKLLDVVNQSPSGMCWK